MKGIKDISETLGRFAREVMRFPEFAPVDARDSPEYCDAYNKVLRDVFGDAADEHLISPRTAK